MSIETPPPFHSLGAWTYLARPVRRTLQSLGGDLEGVLGTADLAVSPTAPASLSVQVAAGRAFVAGDAVARQGVYHVENTATLTVGPVGNAHGSLGRIDLVVLEDLDSSPDGGSAAEDVQRVRIIPGVASATPAAPALPANAIALAELSIPAPGTSIGAEQITDRRQVAASQRPAPFVNFALGLPAMASNVNVELDLSVQEQQGAVFWDAAQPKRFTIPPGMGGVWAVEVNVGLGPSAAGNIRLAAIQKNGGSHRVVTQLPQVVTFGASLALGTIVRLVPGEWLTIVAYQDTGGPLAAGGALSVARIGG